MYPIISCHLIPTELTQIIHDLRTLQIHARSYITKSILLTEMTAALLLMHPIALLNLTIYFFMVDHKRVSK